MDVDRSGTAEEVVAPHLLQQLRPGEHPSGVLREILQQFEFLVGQIKWAAAQPCRVGALVDDKFTQAHLADALLIRLPAAAADQESQPGVDLSGTGARQQDLVDTPVGVHRDQAAFVDHRDHRN